MLQAASRRENSVPKVSAVIITRNEAANIAACLDSLTFCDEVIVVDCGSDDGTVELAQQRGARVIHHEWTDHGTQKNIALSHATGDWAFSIDADERVTPALAAQLQQAMANDTYVGYEMPRLSTFCGRTIWHSGWYPDRTLRLFRRDKARFSDHLVHTRILCDGPVGRLTERLIHHPVIRLEDALSRMDRYSTAGAEMIIASGRRVWFSTGIVRGITAFLRSYVWRAGFLDGREGFILALINAEGTYYRYMKAWLATRRPRQ
jgi:glycosyltransferase involved in cell wall biosynthesis